MALIKLTPEELRLQSNIYGKSAGEITVMLGRLDGVQREISANWDGEAWNKFEEQYGELSKKVRDFSNLLEDIDKQLKEVARVVEETDREIASKLGFK
ncbi:MAG: WXG100 family type VII secretion target [Culicoidibacterales bacterium]